MRIVLFAALVLLAGCTVNVTGSSSTGTTAALPTTATSSPESTGPESTGPEPTNPDTSAPDTPSPEEPTDSPLPLPPIDESAPTRFCDQPFTGALGKPMLAAVVETPSGRLNCDQAGAVLVDYYAERHDPTAGRPPLVVAGMTCNQVPEPALPQVVCTDGADVIYSMWPQT
ncbi:hypothetical protein ABZ816_02800 [Actinosynnema sp. NPDC047251]|uniref:Secreted protein n=1 Tax=Saccharothrix espanaensis (strain ATCC 51144 / DSM 44229 / JCM 9112 / NBRC 15066 / NRRL 15764) TaxID=1179773 RepID=K0K0W6_SACES|nr:hypothetical protein [Saccharothrix espanaensis]CCH31182.1 hypothetical protein BN6_38930 [Saccharothrix espanaensis DSM 44229]